MFGTIRRHQTWLWVIVATITIISFIAYFNPASRGDRGPRGEGSYGTLNGQPISEQDFQGAVNEIVLRYRLSGQKVDRDAWQIQFEAYQTLFFASKEEALGIQVDSAAAAAFAQRNILGRTPLPDFVEQGLKPLELNQSDFDRFLRHQVALRELVALAGASGMVVTPAEAETVYRAQNRQVAATMVFFPYTNYLDKVTNSSADVLQFYLNGMTNYMIPEKVAVNYVKFPATNYLDEVKARQTNLDQTVSRLYDEAGTNLPPGTKTPEEAKAKIREELLLANAQNDAQAAANNFAEKLDQAHAKPEDMETIAKSNNLVLQTTPPFDEDGPEGLKVPAMFTAAAFRLSNNAPFTGRIPADDGAYVLGFKERIASKVPELKDIQPKVAADLRETKAREMAADAAAKFSASVEDQLNVNNGVTLPKDFATICADDDLKPEMLPPLALSQTNLPPDLENRVSWPILRNAAFSTQAGTASKAANAPGGAFVLYVDRLLPADLSKMASELPKFLSDMRSARQNEAFGLWINGEINRDSGLVATLEELEKRAGGQNAPSSQK